MDLLQGILGPILIRFDLRALFDIAIVALVLYWLLTLISGTSAATLVRGIMILLLVGFILSTAFNLVMLGFLLRSAIPALLVAVPILFAPELRRALEQLGRAGSVLPRAPVQSQGARVAEVIATAANRLAERRWGALMVLERETALGDYAQSGIPIDGLVSVDLLLNIFYPNSPLHDGAVLIRGDRVVAAGVVLPLSDSTTAEHVGTRHRAGLGITERTDAIGVVVSEESGRISIANSGRMVRNLSEERLRKVLAILERASGGTHLPGWRGSWFGRSGGSSGGLAA